MRLTCVQAQRLWGLDAQTCASLLASLVEAKFLCLRDDGTYGRHSERAVVCPPELRNSSHPLQKDSHAEEPILA